MLFMKKQKITWNELMVKIMDAKKDPEFLKALNEFVRYHTGKSPR